MVGAVGIELRPLQCEGRRLTIDYNNLRWARGRVPAFSPKVTSASGGKADITNSCRLVAFDPKADIGQPLNDPLTVILTARPLNSLPTFCLCLVLRRTQQIGPH